MHLLHFSASLLAVLLAVAEAAERTKPYVLKILDIHNEGADGDYYEISNLAADLVNNRSDILPDYHIEFTLMNENNGRDSAKGVVNFFRQDDDNLKAVFKSPVIIGPETAIGGSAIGSIADHLDVVAIASSCPAPSLADHQLYPNLYLTIETAQFTSLAILHFMRAIGWKHFALFSNADNRNAYAGAVALWNTALQNGFIVSWFSMTVNEGETADVVKSLKANDARVIVLLTGTHTVLYTFLCIAYRAGITGPRYAFITTLFAISEPWDLTDDDYPPCNQSTLYGQLQQSFFVGQAQNVKDHALVSSLGPTQAEFDALLYQYITDGIASDEPFRYTYFDTHVKAFFALHDAEETLKTMNLSLRNYYESPGLVASVVNKSVLNVNVSGLHIKQMTYNKVNGQPEGEGHLVAQWTPSKGLQPFAIAGQLRRNTSSTVFSNYFIKLLRPIDWQIHPKGRQPNDHATEEVIYLRVPKGVFVGVTLIAGLFVICATSVLVFGVFTKKFQNDSVAIHCTSYLGSVILCTSAACFAYDGINVVQWIASITLLALGLALCNGVLVLRAIVWHMAKFPSSKPPSRAIKSVRLEVPTLHYRCEKGPTVSTTIAFNPKQTNMTFFLGCSSFFIINFAVLLSWFLADPIKCSWELLSESVYDPLRDVVSEKFMNVCSSQHFNAWALSLSFGHFAWLVAGNWLAYIVARRLRNYPPSSSEFTYVRLGLVNAVTLLLGGLMIVVGLPDLISQQIALAFIVLIYSVMTEVVSLMYAYKLRYNIHAVGVASHSPETVRRVRK